MNVIALISPEPGLRYRGHLFSLQQCGVELHCVQVGGLGVTAGKVRQQVALLRKKGLRDFVRWRMLRAAASPSRQEVMKELELRCAHLPYARADLPRLAASFSGFSNKLVRYLNQARPDFIIQCGAWLLPAAFVAQVPPILNLHPGILPGIRGLDPVFWALYYKRADWLGSTLHIIDAGIDTGKPLLRRVLARHPGDSLADLIVRQHEVERELLQLFVKHYPDGLKDHDAGGAAGKGIYRSTWTQEQYEALKAADWWGTNLESVDGADAKLAAA